MLQPRQTPNSGQDKEQIVHLAPEGRELAWIEPRKASDKASNPWKDSAGRLDDKDGRAMLPAH